MDFWDWVLSVVVLVAVINAVSMMMLGEWEDLLTLCLVMLIFSSPFLLVKCNSTGGCAYERQGWDCYEQAADEAADEARGYDDE